VPQLSQDEWLEWRDHPVTLALREAIRVRINQHLSELADPDSTRDRDILLKGHLMAYDRILNASPADGDLITEELFRDEV
jgi:hypothetical protein